MIVGLLRDRTRLLFSTPLIHGRIVGELRNRFGVLLLLTLVLVVNDAQRVGIVAQLLQMRLLVLVLIRGREIKLWLLSLLSE